jgi:hypothetical protein
VLTDHELLNNCILSSLHFFLTIIYLNPDLKVGCLHRVACTRSGSGFPSNVTLV